MIKGENVRITKIAKIKESSENDLELGEYIEGKLTTSIMLSTPVIMSNFNSKEILHIYEDTFITRDGIYRVEVLNNSDKNK